LQELGKIDFTTTDISKFILIMLEKLVLRRTVENKVTKFNFRSKKINRRSSNLTVEFNHLVGYKKY